MGPTGLTVSERERTESMIFSGVYSAKIFGIEWGGTTTAAAAAAAAVAATNSKWVGENIHYIIVLCLVCFMHNSRGS